MSAPSERLTGLGRLARAAGAMAQDERTRLVRELKADGSIVTNGDRAVETFLRKELTAFVPGTTVWGEEFGFAERGEAGRWLVDPIDGTSNYAFGSPLWGVSIALEVEGRLTIGAVMLPDLDELYLAEDGGGAFLNERPMTPIEPGPIRKEELTNYGERPLKAVGKIPGKQRVTGAFVVDATFAAGGRYRAMVAMREKLYDVAACVILGREVGMDIVYVDGSPFEESELMQDVKIERPWAFLPRDNGWVVPRGA